MNRRTLISRGATWIGLTAVMVALLGLAAAPAGARNLEIPTFLTPGLNPDLSPSSLPGGRPYELADIFALNQEPTTEELADGSDVGPVANLRDLRFDLSPGVVANAVTFPRCSQESFSAGACSTASQVGIASLGLSAGKATGTVPIFNLVPPPGMPAQFAFRSLLGTIRIDFHIRNGSDYGVTASVDRASEAAGLLSSSVRIWGVPGDPAHDALRFAGNGSPAPGPYPEAPPFRPLLSNPTSCDGPVVTTMETDTWQQAGQFTSAPAFEAPGMGGCNQLAFEPTIEARPSTNLADSPTGLDFHLTIPQNQDPNGTAAAHLRTARVILPAGLDVNPSAANGLGVCTPEQIGLSGIASQRQLLRYDMPPVNFSDAFVVTYEGHSTAPIRANASRATVTAALETLPGLAGNVSLGGAQGGWIVSFTGALAGKQVAKLSGTVTENPGELITVTGEAGTFKLAYAGAETDPLPFDATAAEVQAALRAIPALGLGNLFPGNVFVRGAGSADSSRAYLVIFAGDLTGTVPPLSATSNLIGPEAGVTIEPQTTPPSNGLSVATLGGIAPGTPQFTPAPAGCPDSSKIGTVRIDSPAVLGKPLTGNVFLASPGRNPFGSLLAFYVVAEDSETGIVLKLPGKVESDPASGRVVASASEAPQLPFEDLQIELFKGAAAPLKTGVACGSYEVNSAMTPWSAPEAPVRMAADRFEIDKGAAGGACPGGAAPDTTQFEAGTVEPTAGSYSPFVVKLSRQDGGQPLRGIDTTLPEGLLARITGFASCSDAALAAAASHSGEDEQRSASCPSGSQVGSVAISAGAGPAPYNLAGRAYLAGPYRGAPISIAVVAPAVVGPFDLGTVVTRSALYVDPKTTRVHVVSDPLPQTLHGIPLDLRSVALTLDAGGFAKNPTSCNPLTIDGIAGQSGHFQVGDCNRIAFKPKLEVAMVGGSKRGAHPALRVTLSMPAKKEGANPAAISLALPKSEILEKSRIGAICAAGQDAPGSCPATTAYGAARATTPLLGTALEGPVYLRKSAGKLPDLVVDLHGLTDVMLEGHLEQMKGGALRANFEHLPDAPLSKLTLEIGRGKKHLLRNAVDLCAHPQKARAVIDGQNAVTSNQRPLLEAGCKKKKKKGEKHGAGGGKR
jgi:hypothetical protein